MPSVTELVRQAPAKLIERWRKIVANDAPPAQFFDRFVLLVEDASPDSCLGLILLLARLNGIAPSSFPSDWTEAVGRWEGGEVLVAADPSDLYGPLHNALVHRHFDTDWCGAWVDALRLMAKCIAAGVSPTEISRAPRTPEIAAGLAFLEFERQAYNNALREATIIQLVLPMTGPSPRFRMVDALIMTGGVPSDGFKNFARTDRANAPLGEGFTLLAVYRPEDRGRGHIVFSVTPESYVNLRDLWQGLEQAEERAWELKGLARPCDEPRANIRGYPGQRRPDGGPSPNQPWYDGGDYTLVAAPYAQEEAPAGTLLEWPDICELLWETYNPYRDAVVLARSNSPCRLTDCPPAIDGAGKGRQLIYGRRPQPAYPREGESGHEVIARLKATATSMTTPTLRRFLAAVVLQRSRSAPSEVRLSDLPEEDDYVSLDIGHSIAVIHQAGVFVLDDWHGGQTDIGGIADEFDKALRMITFIEESSEKVGRLVANTHDCLHGTAKESETSLLRDLTDLELALTRHRIETETSKFDVNVRRFRDVLHACWGIDGRVERFYEAISRTSGALRAHSELRSNRTIALLTAYGFPVAIGATFFGFIFAGIPVGIAAIAFLVFVVVGARLINLYLAHQERASLIEDSYSTDVKPELNRPGSSGGNSV